MSYYSKKYFEIARKYYANLSLSKSRKKLDTKKFNQKLQVDF